MPRASRFIISHRVYTQRMLLKAEFQPQSPARAPIDRAIEAAGQIILGKETQVRLALACLLARGHLLIEDLPGVGKTTLAHVLARSLGLQFQRIQFTSDMLPADILGVSIYERDSGGFKFHPGPIFAQVILADEVNRATPKTQSALLEDVQAIVEYTRRSPHYVAGLSPRAALALVHSARAWALLEGRDKVIPEDVQAILAGVAAHRLRPAHDSARRIDVGAQLLSAVPIP